MLRIECASKDLTCTHPVASQFTNIWASGILDRNDLDQFCIFNSGNLRQRRTRQQPIPRFRRRSPYLDASDPGSPTDAPMTSQPNERLNTQDNTEIEDSPLLTAQILLIASRRKVNRKKSWVGCKERPCVQSEQWRQRIK